MGTMAWGKKADGLFYSWGLQTLMAACILCDRYAVGSQVDVYDKQIKDKAICVGGDTGDHFIGLADSDYTDGNALQAALSGATLMYALASPIYTPLTAEELAQFAATKTVKSFIQVFNDSGVEMSVSYNADTETFIDNKVAERMPRNTTAAPSIIEEKTGEIISVSDSSDDYIQGLSLFGKTTQFTTTGKNLFNLGSALSSNCALEINGDTVRIYTTSAGTYRGLSSSIVRLTAGTTYTISMHLDRYVSGTVRFGMRNINNAFISGASKSGVTGIGDHSVTFKPTEDIDAYLSILVTWADSSEIGDVTFSNIQLEIGTAATSYEPYTGGIPAPNPDYPQELVSVGAKGSVDVSVRGKNLYGFDRETFVQRWVATMNTPFPPGTYTISGMVTSDDIDAVSSIVGFVSADESRKTYGAFTRGVQQSKVISVDYPVAKIWFMASDSYGTGAGDTCTWSNVQIERGATATEYESFKSSQMLTASTPNGLPGIPVTSGGNYTDENGHQWICDEIDFGRGVYVKRVGVFEATGAEDWVRDTTNVFGYKKLSPVSVYISMGACSHFINKTVASARLNNGECTLREAGYVYMKHTAYDNVNDFKAWLSEQYNAGTPVTLHYWLATPIETALSANQLAAYGAPHTNKPNTTVYNDSNAGMKLTYNADPKTYIDSKFAELAAAIVNNT